MNLDDFFKTPAWVIFVFFLQFFNYPLKDIRKSVILEIKRQVYFYILQIFLVIVFSIIKTHRMTSR